MRVSQSTKVLCNSSKDSRVSLGLFYILKSCVVSLGEPPVHLSQPVPLRHPVPLRPPKPLRTNSAPTSFSAPTSVLQPVSVPRRISVPRLVSVPHRISVPRLVSVPRLISVPRLVSVPLRISVPARSGALHVGPPTLHTPNCRPPSTSARERVPLLYAPTINITPPSIEGLKVCFAKIFRFWVFFSSPLCPPAPPG